MQTWTSEKINVWPMFLAECVKQPKSLEKNWHFLWLLQCRISAGYMHSKCPAAVLLQSCTRCIMWPFTFPVRQDLSCAHAHILTHSWCDPCHSCTSGLVMCTCTRPYPFLMWSLPDPVVLHAIWSLSFPAHQDLSCAHAHVLTHLLMWPLPGPVVLHAWKTSLTCKLHGYNLLHTARK